VPPAARPLGEGAFAAATGAFVLLSLLLASATARLAASEAGEPWALLLGGLLLLYGGYELASRTPDWRGSLAGLVAASVGVGAALSFLVAPPAMTAVRHGWLLACAGLATLLPLAFYLPGTVRGFGTFALGAAAGLACLSLASSAGLAPRPTAPSVAVGLLVLGYLDYYWTLSLRHTRDLNHAVDSACAVYFDLIDRVTGLADRATTRRRLARNARRR
jgi:hypothetical protein